MAPDSAKVPAPVLVSPKLPETGPDSVSRVPATLAVLSALIATAPDKLLVPVEAAMVPPLRVMASAKTAAPCRSSVAPLATEVPAEVAPRPAALVTAKVPALTLVVPV